MAEDNEDSKPREETDPADVANDDTTPHDEATSEDETPASSESTFADAEVSDETPDASAADAEPEGPILEAVPDPDDGADDGADGRRGPAGAGDWSELEDPARQLISSLEGFLGGVFKDASEAVERLAARTSGPRPVDDPPEPAEPADRRADPTAFVDTVEDWLGDFFRGGPVSKAAAGFGRAAAGSAFKSATKNNGDDVWASATAAETHGDASRECRYCPYCQTLAAVRNTRPELYEQIGDTAKTLVDLVRQAAEQSKSRWPRR
ncbi:MAG: hypothetical protein GEV07_23555 [Streptosporangiales bacterium]|nr:hypothetical protein [Streptosporangiales bacterium]